MRFIRQEEVITTICNVEIEKDDEIESLMHNLKKQMISFSLTIKKLFTSDYTFRKITYDDVKVMSVDGENHTVDFMTWKGSSAMHLKHISFDDITEIFALTQKTGVLESSKRKTIWEYIDLEDD